MKVINGHVNVLIDDDGVCRTARGVVADLNIARRHITELEAALSGFTEDAPINWDAASIPQSVPFDPENPVHRNQAVGSMSVGYARIYAARKLLNLPRPEVTG